MAAPKSTVWSLDPHTKAKHDLLRGYLGAWFPILSSRRRRIVYYDGFAGPGRYVNGEPGSPLIALEVARNHQANLARELVFIFVEYDEIRAAQLVGEIEALDLPDNFKTQVLNLDFETALSSTLDGLDEEGLQIAPTFALIDPFGIKQIPFELISRLISRPHCEALITFMNMPLQRFAEVIPDQINELMGHDDAAERLAALPTANQRVVLGRQLYEESLRRGASFVRSFEMRNSSNRPLYDLFFASKHSMGHEKIKEAMWRLDSSGEYSFSDGISSQQPSLFTRAPNEDLAPVLWKHFRGQTVYSEDVIRFVWDETAYLDRHARGALRLLEGEGGFEGQSIRIAETKRDGGRRIRNTYPDGTRITFVEEG